MTSTRSIAPKGDRIWRPILFAIIVGVHLLLLLWLMTVSTAARTVRPPDAGLITISLSGSGGATVRPRNAPAHARAAAIVPVAVAASPAPVPAPSPVPSPVPSDVVPLAAAEDPDTGAGSTIGGCALAHDSGQAIAQDPLAMAELDSLPAGMRSSADAVMLWNGQWLNDAAMSAAGGALRRAVEKAVLAAPLDCRDAEVNGPQFVQVAEASRTVMIVIGSGSWRWSDLLKPRSDCPAADGPGCAAPPGNDPDR